MFSAYFVSVLHIHRCIMPHIVEFFCSLSLWICMCVSVFFWQMCVIIIVWSVKSGCTHSKRTLSPFKMLIRTHKNLLNKSHSIIIMIIYSFIYNRHYVRSWQTQFKLCVKHIHAWRTFIHTDIAYTDTHTSIVCIDVCDYFCLVHCSLKASEKGVNSISV